MSDSERTYHRPVMLDEVIEALAPRAGGLYLDGTLGGGGHSAALLAAAPDLRVWGVDRDSEALREAGARLAPFGPRFHADHARFDELAERWERAGRPPLSGVLLDLGVSSHQLDAGERGFSFRQDGPLDMRMDPSRGRSAADLIAGSTLEELEAVLRRGEVPRARGLARAMLDPNEPLETTGALARLVERVLGAGGSKRRSGIHPATLAFQALRVAVNEELEALERFLDWLPEPLAAGGRVVIIAYHSLEDRLVKRRFRELSRSCTCPPQLPICVCGGVAAGCLVTPRALHASDGEVASNPRSRSAVLRAWERSHDPRA